MIVLLNVFVDVVDEHLAYELIVDALHCADIVSVTVYRKTSVKRRVPNKRRGLQGMLFSCQPYTLRQSYPNTSC